MPYLEIKLGPDTLLLQFIGRIDYVFGRLPRADVQLRDMKVSRLHTQFFIDSHGGAFVRDLGSSGGTFIGNQRLRRGVIAPLVDQTKVKVGDARITFYDAEPPVNAVQPPAHSDPRGLIRTNARERHFEAEATVLAVDKVDPETQSGPAEPPPEVNPADFTDEGTAPPPKRAPRPAPKKKPDTGIVEAPWEKKESGRVKPGPKDEVVSLPGGRKPTGKVPPQLDAVPYDETGNLKGADVPPPAPEPQQVQPQPAAEEPVPPAPVTDESAEPAPPEELDETGRTARSSAVDEGSGAFQPPPPIAGELPADDDDDAPPKLGMPTVRLEKPDIADRRMKAEEPSEEPSPRIPTAKLNKAELEKRRQEAEAADQESPAPKIGMSDEEREKAAPVKKEKPGYEDELTDTQIAEYLGGSASGRFGDVNFGGGTIEQDEDDGEVEFGAAAVNIDDADDIDIDDEEAVAETGDEVDEPATNAAVDTTSVEEEPAEAAPDAAEAAPEEPAAEAASGDEDETPTVEVKQPTADEGAAEEAAPKESADDQDVDVPSFEQKKTPPPPTRQGATKDRAFKPRKTRKLMKRKTSKITDKKVPTPPPSGDKTALVTDQPVAQGSDTMFIPKPDDAKLSRANDDNGKQKDDSERDKPEQAIEDMGHGPGGDTVALPPAMMKKLHEELKGRKAGKAGEEKPATIGESPTVKKTDEEDEDEEFVLDEDYAFFTPPPPTRRGREQQQEDDVIDANDFNAESENLPADKKPGGKRNDDTIVE